MAKRDLIQGTLDMLILKTVARGPLHGYAIAVSIETRSSAELRVEEGALYPALHRLEVAELLSSEWKFSETGRRAKFYKLTRTGRKRLETEVSNWVRLTGAVGRVLEIA
jgi:transcriptional regulator